MVQLKVSYSTDIKYKLLLTGIDIVTNGPQWKKHTQPQILIQAQSGLPEDHNNWQVFHPYKCSNRLSSCTGFIVATMIKPKCSYFLC